MAVRRAVLKV